VAVDDTAALGADASRQFIKNVVRVCLALGGHSALIIAVKPVSFFSARNILLVASTASAAAMLYVGAYQVRAVEHMSCPLLKHGCEAVADAPFARPFGVPDGLIAAGLYGLVILLVLAGSETPWIRYALRGLAVLAALANILGVYDMARFGAFCFYCLLTTVLSPVLVWAAFAL
jgi:uncharacterized membrane protein